MHQLQQAFSATRGEIEVLRKALDSSQKKWWKGKAGKDAPTVSVDMSGERAREGVRANVFECFA